jgi:hypothetical protein
MPRNELPLEDSVKTSDLGGNEMAEPKVTAPKQGELVTCTQQEGIFEVVGVNTLMQTADIRLEDRRRHVIPSVPWTALKPLDKM